MDEELSIHVQWKGTDVCFDFDCPCGAELHFDGYSAYAIQCPRCGSAWDVEMRVKVLPLSNKWKPVMMDDFDESDDIEKQVNALAPVVARYWPRGGDD